MPDIIDTEVLSPALATASQPYIGEWNHLVSTANWEKGRIIVAWRGALIDSGAAASEFADEAWAKLVGGVTGQHVGRLRRVYQKFNATYAKFAGLYWSHFQAATEWDDAEMWLEGAVQSGWSVSQMRHQRWETMGALAADAPRAEDVVASEIDEDFEPAQRESPVANDLRAELSEIAPGPRHEGPDFGDEDEPRGSNDDASSSEDWSAAESTTAAPVDPFRPFADLAELPDDVQDAVEKFKLLILKHRREGWAALAAADLVAALGALQQLALAPLDENAPF